MKQHEITEKCSQTNPSPQSKVTTLQLKTVQMFSSGCGCGACTTFTRNIINNFNVHCPLRLLQGQRTFDQSCKHWVRVNFWRLVYIRCLTLRVTDQSFTDGCSSKINNLLSLLKKSKNFWSGGPRIPRSIHKKLNKANVWTLSKLRTCMPSVAQGIAADDRFPAELPDPLLLHQDGVKIRQLNSQEAHVLSQ